MSAELAVALWQGAGVAGDIAATLMAAESVLERAAAVGAELLVFPEGYLTGYFRPGLAPGMLAEVPEALAHLARLAARHRLAVVVGTHIAAADGSLRNAAVVIGPDGEPLGRYDKRALFGAWERATFVAGAGAFAFTLGGLRIGVLICYDVEFPELVRAHARAGADLVVVPTALMRPHDRVARLLVPARAMENQFYLGYANRTGHEGSGPGRLEYPGLSALLGPDGAALARAGAAPELLHGHVSRSALAAVRDGSCYLDDLDALGLGA